jgi:hypothetical protein
MLAKDILFGMKQRLILAGFILDGAHPDAEPHGADW